MSKIIFVAFLVLALIAYAQADVVCDNACAALDTAQSMGVDTTAAQNALDNLSGCTCDDADSSASGVMTMSMSLMAGILAYFN